jgi:predicted nucleic acid-binding protein
MRIFLDANILFSGTLPQSRMRAFLDFLCRECDCVTNAYAVEEARRNLAAKFPAAVRHLDAIVKKCELVPAVKTDFKVKLALKDVPILGGTLAAQAKYLLTGDEKDFGQFFGKTIDGVKVVSPKMLAEELTGLGLL